MDFWQRARAFAEEATTKTHDLTLGSSKLSDLVSDAAKRSKDLAAVASKKSLEIAAEASKKSLEIAAEASKKSLVIAAEASDVIRAEAVKRADMLKFQIPASTAAMTGEEEKDEGVERFGVTDELRDFVKGITVNTFRDFPLQDDSEVSDIPTVSNVRQDLTPWQEKHAKIVLSTVKEISKLRYELCPRAMKERKFWRIYFILVNSHVSPYEKRYTEESMLKSTEQVKNDEIRESSSGTLSKSEAAAVEQKSQTSSANEQDLDVFLLGDLGDSDDGPDDGDRDFDDDFDKL